MGGRSGVKGWPKSLADLAKPVASAGLLSGNGLFLPDVRVPVSSLRAVQAVAPRLLRAVSGASGSELSKIITARRLAIEQGRITDALGMVSAEISAWRTYARETDELLETSRVTRSPWFQRLLRVILEALEPHEEIANELRRMLGDLGVEFGPPGENTAEYGLNVLREELENMRDSFAADDKATGPIIRKLRAVVVSLEKLAGSEQAHLETPTYRELRETILGLLGRTPAVFEVVLAAVERDERKRLDPAA